MEIPSTRKRILEKSETLFRRFGIRSVTMDDIARELGMSKKTLYQEFRNKADIVYAVSASHFDEEKADCQRINTQANDPIQEMIMLIEWIAESFRKMNPRLVYELRKYYPRSWELFHQFENDFLLTTIKESLLKGIASGLFREEINPDIVSRIRISQLTNSFDPEIFPPDQFDFADVVIEGSHLFLHGLVTMKGKKLIYKYLNRPEDE